ncbi:acetyl-CoA acetyltransferase [Paracoccus sanguinis]|uniref:acetyl-CoA acetyltransferase n=1 Tax=Paracoccus sanguinis TaxID=1545044 RepID=UPI000A9DB9FD|nr:acetyl-CoA acetyltransferase [Paracoccus sanguinis]
MTDPTLRPNDPLIVGWAHTKFGKSEAPDTQALMAEVAGPALAHAGVTAGDVDGIFVGVWNNGFSRQDFQGALVAMDTPELAGVPFLRTENACATGSAALYAAADFIASGRGRVALVIGAEKMTATPVAEVGDILLAASFVPEEAGVAGGFAGVFGQIANSYFQRHGDRSEELAMIAAKNHANGARNPLAHMQKDLGVDFCNTPSDKNPLVAGPLRRTDCSLISDGAAALVLADAETAAGLARGVRFRARAQAGDLLALSRRDPIAFQGAHRAWAGALAQAGVGIADLDLVETHDCFTIAEMIEYEAMGLAAPGEGWRVVRDGTARMDGALPVNPSGGLKARGHPIGATGVSQHVMAAMQLMGDAGAMQVPGATLAGVLNMGGAAVANYCSILERVK